MINEAHGYAIERINTAKGDATLFTSVLKEYSQAPEITRDRMYLEAMENVLSKIKNKVIVSSDLENFLPFKNVDSRGVK